METNNLPLAETSARSEIAERLADYAHTARGAFSPATFAAIRSDSRRFAEWCEANGRASMPATPATVADYVDASYAAGSAPASVRRYVSSIAFVHRAAGVDPDPTKAAAVRLALKRMSRTASTERRSRQRQAPALNRHHVDRMAAASGDGLRDIRNRAILATGYDMFARRSEIAGLTVADLEVAADGSAAILIARSKVDQEGRGALAYLAPDTVAAIRAWLTAANITEGPLFRPIRKGGRTVAGAMRSADVAAVLRDMAADAGLDRIPTGHSLRVGACQDAAAAGLSSVEIQIAGRWESAVMPARYSANLEVRRGAAAKLAVLQNRA